MNEEQAIKSLAALAHAVRLRVFRALVVAGTEGLTPSALTEQLGVAASALSFHLKELVHAGLVTQERISRNLFYRADYESMNGVLAYLTENCCAGTDCGQGACTADCTPADQGQGCC
jgi:ArsR family transcriptional regulator